MSDLKRGDKVLYVPHSGHWNDWAGRKPCFSFYYDHPGHPENGKPVEQHILLEARPKVLADQSGKLRLVLGDRSHEGLPVLIKAGAPLDHWPAVVDGVDPDGKTLNLIITHPDGSTREYPNVPVVDVHAGELHCCYAKSN